MRRGLPAQHCNPRMGLECSRARVQPSGRVKMPLALPRCAYPHKDRVNPARSIRSMMRALRGVSVSSSSIKTERSAGSFRMSIAPSRISSSIPSTSSLM